MAFQVAAEEEVRIQDKAKEASPFRTATTWTRDRWEGFEVQ